MEPNIEEQSQAASRFVDHSHLLQLPPNLRHQIYTATEIIGSQGSTFIDLNQRRWKPSWLASSIPPKVSPTLSLLLTCRIIYQEVVVRVYGSNHFFIRYHETKHLSLLRRISALAIGAMTKLTIHVNVTSCGLDRFCTGIHYWSSDSESTYDHEGRSLCVNKPLDRAALEEWHRTWTETLRPNLLVPARMELHLICDVVDSETGIFAMDPLTLTNSQGTLAGCSVRLCRRANVTLQKLTEMVVNHVTVLSQTGNNMLTEPRTEPFRLFDLPIELQRHVLSFTDLITPFREVEWSPRKGMRYRSRLPEDCEFGPLHNKRGYMSHQLPYWANGEDTVYSGCPHGAFGSGCYCRTFHSAFSNIFRCQCWMPPTALFLVCKALRNLVMETFYGSNRFIITPGHGAIYERFWPYYPRTPLPAAVFLRDVLPNAALPHLRFVELVFPPFGEGGPCDYCPPPGKIWQDWVQALDHVKNNLTLHSLTIRVYFAPWIPRDWPGVPPFNPMRAWMYDEHYPEWVRRQKKSYMDVILPLKRLRGLRAFFAYLSVPSNRRQDVYQGDIVRLVELEEEAERVVMGYEYNAFSAGKELIHESIWTEMHQISGSPR